MSIDIFEGSPIRLNVFISGNESESIIDALLFTGLTPQYFKEKVFEIRQIIVAWNNHMNDVFIPLWIYCLDEYFSIWNKKVI